MKEQSETSPLSVVLVHWNASKWLINAVRSLCSSEEVQVNVTVVDNASNPKHLGELEMNLSEDVRVIRLERNLGFSGAANLGLASITRNAPYEDWVAVGAHDVMVDATCLSRILEAGRQHSDYGVLGPILRDDQGGTSVGGFWDPLRGLTIRPRHEGVGGTQVLPCDWIPGALMLLRGTCLQEVGGFDEHLFAYCEDVDICLRAKDAGYRVGTVAHAFASQQGHTLGQQGHTYYITRNSLLITKKRDSYGLFLRRWLMVLMHAFRAAGGSLLITRSRQRRAVSWSYFVAQGTAALDAIIGRAGGRQNAEHWDKS